jgi:crotonobetainyl-CoA:carnitine CoA-transferase CaiB-like acyl-CoA transferase
MALRDYRVIEIGGGSALAYCGKLFADFAAEVIKVEPPGGDPGRLEPPLVDAGGGHKESAYFAWANTGKQSIITDLDDPLAAQRIADLAGAADVVLDSRPSALRQAGPLAHAALRARFPQLTITAMTWFGEHGPYRDYLATDATCRALAGLVSLVGPREKPVAISDHQADIIGALTAFVASLAGCTLAGAAFQ